MNNIMMERKIDPLQIPYVSLGNEIKFPLKTDIGAQRIWAILFHFEIEVRLSGL